jgi:hypothetical protein
VSGDTPSVLDYLDFSELAYDLTEGVAPTVPVPAGFSSLEIASHLYGVNAVAFIDPTTQQIVLSYRGTETSSLFDLRQDVQLATGHRPIVFNEAENFAVSIESNPSYAGYTFTVTGHSLGAAEAEDVAATLQLGGVTFAPPGISSELARGVSATDAQPLTDYVNLGDPIGLYATDTVGSPTPNGSHIGTVETLQPDYHLGNLIVGLDLAGAEITNPLDVLIVAVLTEHFLPLYAQALTTAGIIPTDPLPLKPGAFFRLAQGYKEFTAVLTGGAANQVQPGPVIDTTIGFDDGASPHLSQGNSHPVLALGTDAGAGMAQHVVDHGAAFALAHHLVGFAV